jgi:hypothetical protein
MASDAGRAAGRWRLVVVPLLAASALVAASKAGAFPQQTDDEPVLSVVTAYALEAPTPAPDGPSGTAVARFVHFADGTSDEALRIEVRGLSPASRYDVVIDGVQAPTVVTDERGDATLVLPTRTGPAGDVLPAWVVPITRVAAITLRDSVGTEVLRGDLAAARRRVRALGAGATLSD